MPRKNGFAKGLSTKQGVTLEETDFGVSLVTEYDSGVGEGGSEVVAVQDGLLYITNGEADKIDIVDADSGALVDDIPLAGLPGYAGVQSVAVSGGLIAVAIETDPDLEVDGTPVPGWVVLYDLDGNLVAPFVVGSLPDMVTFSEDGTMVFVANEGEPLGSGPGTEDPAGSISIITLADDPANSTVQTFGFEEFTAEELEAAGVRLFPGKSPEFDLEPEYIAQAGNKLFVTLQEAASVAIFDLETMSWDKIVPLGVQDHSVVPLDPNDDGLVELQTYDNLVGMRMADAIAATEIDGTTYFLTANEGDDRGDFDDVELGDIGDAARIKDILAGEVFLNGEQVTIADGVDTAGLERLKISIFDGLNEAGEIETLHAYGSRSFSIFDEDGNLVFDSGAEFEQLLSVIAADRFNNDDGDILGTPDGDEFVVDNRSDAKGPEPEAIEVGKIGDTTLAFVGLERDGGIVIYDISDPADAKLLDYIDGRASGQESPEIIDFIPASESSTGEAQIAVSYEVSGTTVVYDLPFSVDLDGGNGEQHLVGSIGSDTLDGGNGADTIEAGGGDDVIMGGNGADVIDGGFGADIMTGGRGPDVFVFDFFSGDDEVTDFGVNDWIDLSATGLEFADVTITQTDSGEFLVEYGSFGDSIAVHLEGVANSQLAEDSFIFG